MVDTSPVQASGNGGEAEDKGPGSGREGGGESGGGAYPNPHTGKTPKDGPLGHGGQSEIGYRGGGDEADSGDNPNSVTKGG